MKEFRGKHGKITEDMKKEMREMSDNGVTQKDVAAKFGVSKPTVRYHLDPDQKEKGRISSAKARERHGSGSKRYPEKTRKYMREYMRERYNNDPEFRKRMINHVINSQKRGILKRERLGNETLSLD